MPENNPVDPEHQQAVESLSAAYSLEEPPISGEGPKIKVPHAVATLASLYEKVRQAMEYNEPPLFRRAPPPKNRAPF